MKIGPLLKFWRENKGMTFYRMAQESGIDADYIKKIEMSTEDNDPNIKIETLERLAHALGVPASDLVRHDETTLHLTESEQELIVAFRRLGADGQSALIRFLMSISK